MQQSRKYYVNLIKYYFFDLVRSFISKIEGCDSDDFNTILNPNIDKRIQDFECFLGSIGDINNISFSIENYENDLIKVKGFKKRLFDTEKNNLKKIHKIDDVSSIGTDLVENYQEIMLKSFFGRCGLYTSIKKYAEELIIFIERHIYEKIRNDFHKFCQEFSLEFQEISDSTKNYLLVFKKSYFLNCCMRTDLNLGRLSNRYK